MSNIKDIENRYLLKIEFNLESVIVPMALKTLDNVLK